jgi:hypothetical protein
MTLSILIYIHINKYNIIHKSQKNAYKSLQH